MVAAPDAGLGERVAAVLRLKPGHALPTEDEVRAHFAGQGVARQKWPEVLLEVVDYPRTRERQGAEASGALRRALR